MSDVANSAPKCGRSQSAAGALLLGLALGAGATYSVLLYGMGYKAPAPIVPNPAPDYGGAMGSAGAVSAGPTMGMGGGMAGGGMGGGGNARAKRTLTQWVGKVDLLTRANLHLDLDPEQSAQLASKLAELEKADKMTSDEAQAHLEALEGLLTAEQKEVVDSIGLPFGGRGGAGGPPGGGAPGMGAPGQMGGGPSDENPFQQETNQKRLHDLLEKLQPAETGTPAPEAAPPPANP